MGRMSDCGPFVRMLVFMGLGFFAARGVLQLCGVFDQPSKAARKAKPDEGPTPALSGSERIVAVQRPEGQQGQMFTLPPDPPDFLERELEASWAHADIHVYGQLPPSIWLHVNGKKVPWGRVLELIETEGVETKYINPTP